MAQIPWQQKIRPHHVGSDPLFYDLTRLFLRHSSEKQIEKKFCLPFRKARCLIFCGVLTFKNAQQLLQFWHEMNEPRKKMVWLMEKSKSKFYQDCSEVDWFILNKHLPNLKLIQVNMNEFGSYDDYLGFLSLELQ